MTTYDQRQSEDIIRQVIRDNGLTVRKDDVLIHGNRTWEADCPTGHHNKGPLHLWIDSNGGVGAYCYNGGNDACADIWERLVRPVVNERKTDRPIVQYNPAPEVDEPVRYVPDSDGYYPRVPYHKPGAPTVWHYRQGDGKGKRCWMSPTGLDTVGYELREWQPVKRRSEQAIVAEGEKAAYRLSQLGFSGYSWLGGSSRADKAVFRALSGKDVLLFPDADDAGRYAMAIAGRKAIQAGAKSLRWVDNAGDNGRDSADMPDDELLERIQNAQPYQPPAADNVKPKAKPKPQIQYDVALPQDSPFIPERVIVDEYDNNADPHTTLGLVIGRSFLADRFRWDSKRDTLWVWQENCWVEPTEGVNAVGKYLARNIYLIADALHKAGQESLAKELAGSKSVRREFYTKNSLFWSGLQTSLERPTPEPSKQEVATPEGVVNYLTGEVTPSDPLLHDTRALVQGNFHPERADAYRQLFGDWLSPVLSHTHQEALLDWLGLAMASRATEYRAVNFLLGKSGSGKTVTGQVIFEAFGGRAVACGVELFERAGNSDIDTGIYELIVNQPLLVWSDEGAKSRFSEEKVERITGGSELTARMPHGKPLSGRVLAGFMLSTPVTPRIGNVNTGMARRSIVTPFERQIAGTEVSRNYQQPPVGIHDAIITLSLLRAQQVGKPGWEVPVGDVAATEAMRKDADPISAFIDDMTQEDWDGESVLSACNKYNQQLGENDKKVNTAWFGRHINAHPNWRSEQDADKKCRVLRYTSPIVTPEPEPAPEVVILDREYECPDCGGSFLTSPAVAEWLVQPDSDTLPCWDCSREIIDLVRQSHKVAGYGVDKDVGRV